MKKTPTGDANTVVWRHAFKLWCNLQRWLFRNV